MEIFDTMRGFSVALYGLALAQIGFILFHYFAVLRIERKMGVPRAGLLPTHALVLGLNTAILMTFCVIQNIVHIGKPFNYFILDPFLFGGIVWGLSLVMKFEYVRYRYAVAKYRVSDLNESL